MNELSRIQFETAQENPSYVSGRMLHQALQIKTPYRKWFPRVCIQNEYEEGEDYVTSDKIVRRADGVPMPYDLHDHWLTPDAAKEICLTQHTAIGKLLRKKLIAQEQAVSEARERELISCQNRLARTVQKNEELSASLAAQKEDMAVMGDLIERANAALILQRDVLHKQSRKVDELNGKVARQSKSILEMAPKVSTTTIAKSCGITARALNLFLHEQKVQYRLHDGWVLYARYDGKGYTRTVTVVRKYSNGTEKVCIVTQWTQKGREFIIHLLEKAFDDERGEV